MSVDYINYHKIIDIAMRGVVKSILQVVARDGLQGEHDLFISFLTHTPGVILSDRMKAKYPYEIKIELQYQFSELKTEDEFFSVRLSFGGISEVIVVPYNAITSFEDKGTKFSLEFSDQDFNLDKTTEALDIKSTPIQTTENSQRNIIVLDNFRKKKK